MRCFKSKVWNLVKNYRWQSLFFYYWRSLILVFTVFFAFSISVIYFTYSQSVETEVQTSVTHSLLRTGVSAEQIFLETDKNSFRLSSNDYVNIFLNREDIVGAGLFYTTVCNSIHEYFKTYMATSEYVDSIYIYSSINRYVISSKNSNSIENFYNRQWFEDFKTSDKQKIIKCYTVGRQKLISCIYRVNGDCAIVININTSKLDKIIFPRQDETVIISDPSGETIYTSSGTVPDYDKSFYEKKPDIDSCFISKNNKYITCATLIESQGLFISSATDKKMFLKQMGRIKTTITLCIIVALALSLLLSFWASIRFYDAIADIINRIELTGTANGGNNEIKYITDNFMSIINKNARIENELVSKISTLKQAQTIALQTQINPHFLFNTLNLISVITMKITKSENDASRVILLLADILHFSLDTGEYLISLEDEMRYAGKYIEIELIKSHNGFDVITDIAPETAKLKVIKLSLQPIIENAIEHGIKPRENTRGVLRVSSRLANNYLVITISDNGRGFSPEKLESVLKSFKTDSIKESRHIGLSNINQRIRLIFGEDYGLEITSSPDGTDVTYRIPKA